MWKNNIFKGFTGATLPTDVDSPISNTNKIVDPGFAGTLPTAAPSGATVSEPSAPIYAPSAANSTAVNIAVLNPFKITATSAAIKAGAISVIGGGDFFEANAHPTTCKPDIGAHQFTPTASACQ